MAAEALAPDDALVVWEPLPGPQTALVTCPVFEVFYGGARGGGKTDGVLGEWLNHASEYGSDAVGLMVRRERTQLLETMERAKQIYLPLGAKFNETDKLFRFPDGARLRFAYLDRDSDAEAYQGHSYTRVYAEEVGNFPSSAPLLKLMATLRSAAGVPCGFRGTGNPGGPGHMWVRDRYIDPAPLGWSVLKEDFINPFTGATETKERVYIPSRVTDNRYLGPEYVASLQMSGSPELVRAWLEGDWSVITGAYFPEFSIEKHVLSPFEIPKGWLRFRCADWGSFRPFAVYWCAVVQDAHWIGDRLLPRGAVVVYREWYGCSAPNVGLKMTAEEVADGIRLREAGEAISYGVLDPAAFKWDGGPSIAERIKVTPEFHPADNTRMAGWDQLRQRLRGEEAPMVFMFSTCKHLIRTLPALQHDETKPEDVDTEGEDHAGDALRYGLMSRPYTRPVEKKPVPEYHAKAVGSVIVTRVPTIDELNRKARRED